MEERRRRNVGRKITERTQHDGTEEDPVLTRRKERVRKEALAVVEDWRADRARVYEGMVYEADMPCPDDGLVRELRQLGAGWIDVRVLDRSSDEGNGSGLRLRMRTTRTLPPPRMVKKEDQEEL